MREKVPFISSLDYPSDWLVKGQKCDADYTACFIKCTYIDLFQHEIKILTIYMKRHLMEATYEY